MALEDDQRFAALLYRRDHRAHQRRANPRRADAPASNRERGEVGDGASLSTVVEPRGRDHHVPDDLTLDLRDERELGDEAVRRAEGFDQPRLARLAEGGFDELRDRHDVVTGRSGRIVTSTRAL